MAKPFDVTDADFEQRVLRRSEQVPVLVDFWADWCQPCHMLAPVIEKAVASHDGKVELAKLDVDSNQATAARYGVRGLPTVKAFRDGRVANEFTGAQPPQVVARFVDDLVPSEADALVESGDEAALRRALEVEPNHPVARRELGRALLLRGATDEALELLGAWRPARGWLATPTSRRPSRPGTRATTRRRSSCCRPRWPTPSAATSSAG
jgi:putative thioredoxin